MVNDLQLRPPQKSTVVMSIIEQIVNLINNGNLHPNDQLPSERQLIDMLGVGRSSVREALQGLAAMGLVETRHGEGTFVKAQNKNAGLRGPLELHPHVIQKDTRLQLNRARLILELGIVIEACDRISNSSAQAIMQAYEACYLGNDRNTYNEKIDWRPHDRIHLAIAEATGNRFLVQMLEGILELVPTFLREEGVLLGSKDDLVTRYQTDKNIHHDMCTAIAAGDKERARSCMLRHAQIEEDLIEYYYGTPAVVSEA